MSVRVLSLPGRDRITKISHVSLIRTLILSHEGPTLMSLTLITPIKFPSHWGLELQGMSFGGTLHASVTAVEGPGFTITRL